MIDIAAGSRWRLSLVAVRFAPRGDM